MDSDEEDIQFPAITWNELMDYERADATVAILKKFTSSFFARDTLRLVEREETQCSFVSGSTKMNSLLLYGMVGYERREVFLYLLRYIRLRLVRDVFSSVSVGCAKGDFLPHLLMEPLVDCIHTDGYRRWYRAFYAMRCGVLKKMLERRQMTRDRVEQIIKQTTQESTKKETEDDSAYTIDPLNEDFYRNYFRHLVEENTNVLETRILPLSEYDAATKETKVDIARIASMVPTVFVAWSHRHRECMEWLKQNLFNDTFLKDLRAKTGLSGNFVAAFDADPWIKFVSQYTEIPPRPQHERKSKSRKLHLLPESTKRAQIVLVNTDRDKEQSEAAYKELLRACRGWMSREVNLLSLWAGTEGLLSQFGQMFLMNELPHVIVTEPVRRVMPGARLARPRIIHSPTEIYMEGVSDKKEKQSFFNEAGKFQYHEPDALWHTLPAPQRESLVQSVTNFISQRDVPLFFTARVDRVHEVWNPYLAISTKALQTEVSSSVSLKGMMADRDFRYIRDELVTLLGLANFQFLGQAIVASHPLPLRLDPMTPRRLVWSLYRAVTCLTCGGIVKMNDSAHYRCLHCLQEDFVLCEKCFREGKCSHPVHHLLMRIPPRTPGLSIPLLWGPSNVVPLKRLCNRVIVNKTSLHLGIFCNRCREMISGCRWKCAHCYQYELCDHCFATSLRKEGELLQRYPAVSDENPTSPLDMVKDNTSRHELGHPMLYIPCGRDGDNNDFLRPEVVEGSLLSYLLQLPPPDSVSASDEGVQVVSGGGAPVR